MFVCFIHTWPMAMSGLSLAVSLFLLILVACGPSFSQGCVPAADLIDRWDQTEPQGSEVSGEGRVWVLHESQEKTRLQVKTERAISPRPLDDTGVKS